MEKGIDYIVVDELPIEQQLALKQWLIGKTVPTIEKEDSICCYKGDYDRFMKYDYRGIISKFFKGWITKQITSGECNETWYNEAFKAKEEKCELIVFKIPADKNHLIEDIEKLLQEKLK
jgi:hypothetical protein